MLGVASPSWSTPRWLTERPGRPKPSRSTESCEDAAVVRKAASTANAVWEQRKTGEQRLARVLRLAELLFLGWIGVVGACSWRCPVADQPAVTGCATAECHCLRTRQGVLSRALPLHSKSQRIPLGTVRVYNIACSDMLYTQ